MKRPLLSLYLFIALNTVLISQPYDIVLKGGRVMDPETGLDATRNIGIRGDRIMEITEKELSGKQTYNVGFPLLSTPVSSYG